MILLQPEQAVPLTRRRSGGSAVAVVELEEIVP